MFNVLKFERYSLVGIELVWSPLVTRTLQSSMVHPCFILTNTVVSMQLDLGEGDCRGSAPAGQNQMNNGSSKDISQQVLVLVGL